MKLNTITQLFNMKSMWIIAVLVVIANFTYTSLYIYKYTLYEKIINLDQATYSILKNLTISLDIATSSIFILFIISTWIILKKKDDHLLLNYSFLCTILFVTLSFCNFLLTRLFSVSFYEIIWNMNNFIVLSAIILIYGLIKISSKRWYLNLKKS
ncbi:magnesium-transporting ATPase (P-type) [Cytobacillus purgationiresistens]|uniref:Magnesium-transporting ATPase (P-type) n=1 Tax=Cytobacillus purgationiresistens TaxID=863449 RepID=A0ABU0ALQ3_9BACI|nr:magnesium-transporting ATPase (P-type) [Cytobacillus purgationiresistens]